MHGGTVGVSVGESRGAVLIPKMAVLEVMFPAFEADRTVKVTWNEGVYELSLRDLIELGEPVM
jgi:hypothetical protein